MSNESGEQVESIDVVVVGAGLSGIAAGHWLQAEHANKSYAILEARDAIGGTWDLFRYPGVRSDSDMYTLGYSFRPWTSPKAIASGESIRDYVRETARDEGIDRKIRFRHRVTRASWSSQDGRWTLEVRDEAANVDRRIACKFLFWCSGYYDYAEGFTPELPGLADFQGAAVHPQKWPEGLDVGGKKVVVIGSGATAVTLVPELARRAASVTMLQRSPSYIFSRPEEDLVANGLRKVLPSGTAYALARWKNILMGLGLYSFSRRWPKRARKFFIGQVARALSPEQAREHFTPRYDPWDQRLCLVPEGDLFAAIRGGKASVVTDQIEKILPNALQLRSGKTLECDVLVTATGLKMKLFGGAKLFVDGERVAMEKTVAFRGAMFSGLPNLALAVGYINASWTLKTELTCRYVCALLSELDRRQADWLVPRATGDEGETEPLIGLSSGYVQRAAAWLPKQGKASPWRVYQNYVLDRLDFRRARKADQGLEFGQRGQPVNAARSEPRPTEAAASIAT